MRFLIFGMLTEVEEELIRPIAIILRRASFRFHDLSVFQVLGFHNIRSPLLREKPPEATAKNTQRAFHFSHGS